MVAERITSSVRSGFESVLRVFRPLIDRLRLFDPLLMAAAIAFNWFFALVPLAIALVGVIGGLGQSDETLAEIERVLTAQLPPQIAEFIIGVIQSATDLVGDSQGVWVAVGLFVALWSGSRGIYAIQKSLRLLEGVEESRRYWHVRGVAIILTIVSGAALFVGYVVVLFGEQIFVVIEGHFTIDLSGAVGVGGAILVLWLVLALYLIYRWGPPLRLDGALLSACLTGLLIAVGTAVAGAVMPHFGSSTLSIFGAVGIMLLWLYYTALVVVMMPAVIGPIWVWFRDRRSARTAL